ncbi:hypothetical protein GLAREA_09216 [Glarea lozoyensis ATCC 20868]|uniref:SUR7 family protein pun1 n=1 Tax=Glarea lozoyensis (strain ATCC 20868 / MF5171) TaxID=1116229 RepID=S3EFT6_GLAL2|nr:uncharacterized protein GLAREA_09216 [Glarea lozoyensis ATCC 20868]EPE37053.1 hypothetical protein GLAREA_09216 [Glarea lozoyensis ATCC 20868]
MPLPSFKSLGARRRENRAQVPVQTNDGVHDGVAGQDISSDRTLTPSFSPGVNIKRATRTRKIWIMISSFLFFVSLIFLILVLIGNLNDRPVLRDTYFFTLDLANILPVSAPDDIMFVNSLARSLGLHDFYQVGLWNFCEGYNNEGITYCSPHQTLYWFNPVEILLNELLSGATITLPADINDILDLIKIASHIMFGFFLTGACMNFVNIFLAYITLYSRWWSLFFVIWSFISTLMTVAAAIIATVMFIIFRNVITSQESLNIGAAVGTQMFAFMWTAAAMSLIAWIIHLCLSCCCASRRDVKSGRKRGSGKAYGDVAADEKKEKIGKKKKFGSSMFSSRKSESV